MKLQAFGVGLLLFACIFGGHARVAPHIQSLYKTIEAKQRPVGDIWSDCSKDSDKLKIGKVSVSPDPPKKGDTLMIKANVTFNEQVTSGELKVNLAINKIPFISTNLDLCDTISQAGLSCPISAGSHTLTVSQQIPDEAPSGSYTGNQYLYDQNNNELACVALTLKL